MKSIGQTLKSNRESLGMTLYELESRTQIKRSTLTLIEQNQFSSLTNENYAEGFIKKYANAVNVDANQLIDSHRDEIPDSNHKLDRTLSAFSKDEKPTYRSKDNEPWQLAITMSFVVIITVILWIIAVLLF
ncbi:MULTISPECIES: helix-turn-helix domain-containing protein [Staphylococcus]|uniref:Helix-turn-helix domain-containing protein n=1 Tax=Staphylococcus hsinchuensis TaxID=3051183 RepID=A0ABZ3EAZ1_9STAP|nr:MULTISPECIES: helix-turn-helix domain-containing protein [unclassified Staphylococcus]